MPSALGWRAVEDTWQDVRYGVRSLVANTAFATTALLTLASGIGATTAVFSLVNGVALEPLPFPEPGRLVQMYGTPAIRGEAVDGLEAMRRQTISFETLVGYDISARYRQTGTGPERVMTVSAERGLFSMLRVAPSAGRSFRGDDPATVAVVSERFWKEALGGSSSVIGESLVLDHAAITIIGVMPEAFQFPYGAASILHSVVPQARTDLWLPLDPPADPTLRARGRVGYVTGRLKPGVSIQQAENELAIITRRLQQEQPNPYGDRGVRLEALSEVVVAPPIRRSLFVLLGSVILVLALASANLTNLSLVRMTRRAGEVAVRKALGAGPLRLMRQFFTESLLLTFAGGAVGLLVAWWGTQYLTTLAAATLPRVHEVGLDARVFAFLVAVCAVVGVVVGFAPAVAARRVDTHRVLQTSGTHTTIGGGLRRLRDVLVVAEVASALLLTVGAATLVLELIRLRNTDPGMAIANVVTFHIGGRSPASGIVRSGAPPETETQRFYDIADRVRQIPGVRAAGFTQVLPLQNWGWSANSIGFTVRGRAPQSEPFAFDLRYVTPGYFEALGVPVRRGRGLTSSDTRDAPPVIVINETLARRLVGDADPVGQSTERGTIVGVVGDVRNVNLDQETIPELYYPIAQNHSQLSELGMTLVVRTVGPPAGVIGAVRAAVREVNPNEAIFDVKTMKQVVDESLASFTLFLTLMVVFAVLALVLGITGTYGVIAYVAASRAREFAIRAALGADRHRIMRAVFGQGLALTGLGLAVGGGLVFLTAPALRALPVTVHPPRLPVVAAVAALMMLAALASCILPARRAAEGDPMTVLRNE